MGVLPFDDFRSRTDHAQQLGPDDRLFRRSTKERRFERRVTGRLQTGMRQFVANPSAGFADSGLYTVDGGLVGVSS